MPFYIVNISDRSSVILKPQSVFSMECWKLLCLFQALSPSMMLNNELMFIDETFIMVLYGVIWDDNLISLA